MGIGIAIDFVDVPISVYRFGCGCTAINVNRARLIYHQSRMHSQYYVAHRTTLLDVQ